jgi:hypothetical protein
MSKLIAVLLVLSTVMITGMKFQYGNDESTIAGPSLQAQTGWSAPSADCAAQSASRPKGSTRVYIALRNGSDGSGISTTDARDGSTAAAFDTILRCYSEGCPSPGNPAKSVARTENLIVCLGPGTFSTLGNYDFIVGIPHTNPAGFTIGNGWKIHGAGQDKTTLKLNAYLPITEGKNPLNFPLNTGTGLVFGTNSDDVANIEISDLAIDANYPELKSRARQNGVTALTLEAIHLRSDRGGHKIHDVSVSNVAGEIGGIDIKWEAFHIWIVSMHNTSPSQNSGNLVENVTMKQGYGQTGCGIVIANALGEVRHTLVQNFPIGYGGWKMGEVYFHDNTAIDTEYGINVDSWDNSGVRIESNHIIHPLKFGIVVGGEQKFTNFKILNNFVHLNKAGLIGLVFRGNVTGSLIMGNTVLAENSSAAKSVAIRSYSPSRAAGANQNNTYQSNQIAAGLKVSFEAPSQKSQNCFSGNHDERGQPSKDLPDNHNGPCVPEAPKAAVMRESRFSPNPQSYLQ